MKPVPKRPGVPEMKRDVEEFIRQADEALERGESIDLTPLQPKVQHFCEAINKLEPEARKVHDGEVDRIIEMVKALGEKLKVQYELINTQIDGLKVVREANIAYKRSYAMKTGGMAARRSDNDENKS